jgi:hypothetical protein
MNQRTRYNGFVLDVCPDGVGWTYYIHDFEHPELDCFGTLELEDAAKRKAVQSANVLGLKVGRIPSTDPLVWRDATNRNRKAAQKEAFAVARTR